MRLLHQSNFTMKLEQSQNIYKLAQRFADVTKGKFKRTSQCLQKAEDIFYSGTTEIKSAISNLYVYPVSSFLEINLYCINELFTLSLQKVYLKQIKA